MDLIVCFHKEHCSNLGVKASRKAIDDYLDKSIHKEEQVEAVTYSYCGGCLCGNIEYVPAEMIKNEQRQL